MPRSWIHLQFIFITSPLRKSILLLGHAIGEFRISRRPRRSTFLRESEGNAGHFSPRRQTNMRKLRLSCRKKKGKCETLKGFGGLKTYLQAWDIIVLNSKRKITKDTFLYSIFKRICFSIPNIYSKGNLGEKEERPTYSSWLDSVLFVGINSNLCKLRGTIWRVANIFFFILGPSLISEWTSPQPPPPPPPPHKKSKVLDQPLRNSHRIWQYKSISNSYEWKCYKWKFK